MIGIVVHDTVDTVLVVTVPYGSYGTRVAKPEPIEQELFPEARTESFGLAPVMQNNIKCFKNPLILHVLEIEVTLKN
jgi:hypothetical protein